MNGRFILVTSLNGSKRIIAVDRIVTVKAYKDDGSPARATVYIDYTPNHRDPTNQSFDVTESVEEVYDLIQQGMKQ